MKTYQSHKIVKAVKCESIEWSNTPDGGVALKAIDGGFYEVPRNIFGKGTPQLAFYIVEYEDGYRSWSPAEAFEKGYALLDDGQEPCNEDLPIDAPADHDSWLRQRCIEITNPANNAWFRITEAEKLLAYIRDGVVPEAPTGAAVGSIGRAMPFGGAYEDNDLLAKEREMKRKVAQANFDNDQLRDSIVS